MTWTGLQEIGSEFKPWWEDMAVQVCWGALPPTKLRSVEIKVDLRIKFALFIQAPITTVRAHYLNTTTHLSHLVL